MGGSYGGFMTSWIVGHTDRFRAACSERAVNAMWSMYGTSDIGFWFQEAHAVGRPPWEDLRWYLERSPLSYARDIRTPLLIVHSESDLRCPMEQAEQLYVALKKLKRTVRFVRFPDEDHELSRSGRPRHRLARFRILLEWFGSTCLRGRPEGRAPGEAGPRPAGPAVKRLVLVGGGHAHLHVLADLAARPLPGVEVTLVSPTAVAPLLRHGAGLPPGQVRGGGPDDRSRRARLASRGPVLARPRPRRIDVRERTVRGGRSESPLRRPVARRGLDSGRSRRPRRPGARGDRPAHAAGGRAPERGSTPWRRRAAAVPCA